MRSDKELPEDAVNTPGRPSGQGPSSCHVWVTRRILNSSVLRREYRKHQSILAVAMALNVSFSHAYRALKKAGIPLRRAGRPKKKHAAKGKTLTPQDSVGG